MYINKIRPATDLTISQVDWRGAAAAGSASFGNSAALSVFLNMLAQKVEFKFIYKRFF